MAVPGSDLSPVSAWETPMTIGPLGSADWALELLVPHAVSARARPMIAAVSGFRMLPPFLSTRTSR